VAVEQAMPVYLRDKVAKKTIGKISELASLTRR